MWSARADPSALFGISHDPAICEGLIAYAHHQSQVFASLRRRCHSIWNGLEKVDNQVTEPISVTSEEALLELQGDDV